MILDAVGIQQILPHRYPFLMVDAILEIDRLKRIVGVKNVTINESHFQGHFPGAPVMPGVLIIESMAQTGGLLLLQEVPDREKKLLYFVAVDGARFRRPVVHGPSKFGKNNVFHPFTVIGGDPQDYTFLGERVELVAGDGNIFREYVTVSRGTKKGGGRTSLGNENFFLSYSHVGHDCQV